MRPVLFERIQSSRMPRVAFGQSYARQECALKQAVFRERLAGINGTRGVKTAGRGKKGANCLLIDHDQNNREISKIIKGTFHSIKTHRVLL